MKSKILLGVFTLIFNWIVSSYAGATEYQTFQINQGEDLSAFSKRLYGTTQKWKEIAEINKETLPDPDRPTPGMSLKVRVTKRLLENLGKNGTSEAVSKTDKSLSKSQGTSLSSSETHRARPYDRSPASETQRIEPKKVLKLERFQKFELGVAENNAAETAMTLASATPSETDATDATTSKAVKFDSVTASEDVVKGSVSINYGASIYSGTVNFVNFGVEAGYRFFPNTRNLSLGIAGNYFSAGSSIKGVDIYLNPAWYFSDRAGGLSVGTGLGYSAWTSGGSGGAFSIYPNISYDVIVVGKLGVGIQAAVDVAFRSSISSNVFTTFSINYWF